MESLICFVNPHLQNNMGAQIKFLNKEIAEVQDMREHVTRKALYIEYFLQGVHSIWLLQNGSNSGMCLI